MKRKGRNRDLPTASIVEGNMHFRLCHLCFYLNEGNGEILECGNCKHAFKDESLEQFFDNNDQEAFSDQLEEQEEAGEDMAAPRRKGRVTGLSVLF